VEAGVGEREEALPALMERREVCGPWEQEGGWEAAAWRGEWEEAGGVVGGGNVEGGGMGGGRPGGGWEEFIFLGFGGG
jgi:hypothetical protein